MEGVNLESITNDKGLKIVHVNTRSVFHKLDELKLSLKQFDIIVFTETWLKNSVTDSQLKWDNFQLIRIDRARLDNKSGGGICIYIRSSIDFEIIQDFQEVIGNHIEFLFVKVKPYMQKSINLIGIYRPPDGKHVDFVQSISRILDQIDRVRAETILIGDFNIDFKNKRLVTS